MPVTSRHVVHVNDQTRPPRIGLLVRPARRSAEIAPGGDAIVQESWIVAVRSDHATMQSEVPMAALRPATAEDLHQPGQLVRTPKDQSGDAVFLRAAYPNEAV